MLFLDTTSMILRVTTTTTAAIDVAADYTDFTSSSATGAKTDTAISSATTTTVVAAPGSGTTQRGVKTISFRNKGTSANTLTVERYNGTTAYQLAKVSLGAGETLQYSDGWTVLDSAGRVKQSAVTNNPSTARQINWFKVGVASEAAGLWHSDHAATGFPGVWAPGTPGVAGRATDGMVSADAGCLPLWTPTGSLYLTEAVAQTSLAQMNSFWDVLWVNSGLVVTTTTAQTVNSVAFPARDLDGAVNGRGCMVGILVTTATTNAGAITNTTMSYTNSAGTAGRTATISSFPATAVAGAVIWFQLAAGDEGVQSIQSVTLGTTYGGGAISLILARSHARVPCNTANLPFISYAESRLYTGSCLLPINLKSNTTASTNSGSISVEER